ncbi:DUF2971 domain-containing protein [Serratia sp. CY43514]|uniref:DUF2971 domain-containing protein n=1 Tax=Serratia sp. CY43514 TaxID=3383620 RepID=UPI004029A540
MSFSKYVDLISSRKLFLCRSDLFKDKFEGCYPSQQGAALEASLQASGDLNDEQISFIVKNSLSVPNLMKAMSYVSCWHANEYESAAMWDIYAKNDESIAIETTYEALKESFPDGTNIGLIDYIDYNTDVMEPNNMFTPLMHKRKSFQHENEVRVIMWTPPKGPIFNESTANNKPGIQVDIDIQKLIKNIYVSPTSASWFVALVKEVSNKYSVPARITQSNLYSDPMN